MKDKILSYLTFGNRFFSVEQTQLNNEPIYYGIQLKKSKNLVEIENSFQFNTLDESSKHIPKNKAIFLVINNESVITKTIESKDLDTLKLLHTAFPNIKTDDFYYEVLKQDSVHFISICRKAYLDELLDKYKSQNISVIDFSLGNLMIASISSLISEDKIQTSNAIITKEDNQISAIELNQAHEIPYNFNDTDLNNHELLTFSSALSLVTKSKEIESVFGNTTHDLLSNFKEKQFFTQFIKIGMSFLFVLLLGNFLLFNNYYDKVNALKETALVLNTSKDKVVSLSEKVQKAQKMVEDVLKSNASKSSFYANAIINSLPDVITLSELNYQPLLKKIKADKPIENDTDAILVSGTSSESVIVSEWISHLETMDWVDTIEIFNFEDVKKSSSVFSFKIHIANETKN